MRLIAVLVATALPLSSLLPSFVAAGATPSSPWHRFWYDLGIYGAHPTVKYKSSDIRAPELNIVRWDPRCELGYVLLSPRGHFYPEPGPLIYDSDGELVWIENRFGMIMDLNLQQYRGEQFLTFWVGYDDGTRGEGVYYMLNSSYEVAHVVAAVNGHQGDVHEFRITPNDTALISIYEITQMDLLSVGRASDGWVYDGLFQEIDIATGELLFEWRARDHYTVDDSFFPIGDKSAAAPTAADAYDYFHINSIDKHPYDGTYLISSRYLHSITCISSDGEILWILGGKRNMFTDLSDGAATSFTWQHDARWFFPNNNPPSRSGRESKVMITLLDNGANEHTRTADYTAGLLLSLDLTHMTATTVRMYNSPGSFSSHSQGNLQVLRDSGNVFIGWGKPSAFTEFTADASVLCDTHYGPSMFFRFGWVKSYRAKKVRNWIGRPQYPPDVALDQKNKMLYVSWNGATEVDSWVLQQQQPATGLEDCAFKDVAQFPKTGFETSFRLPTDILKHDGNCHLRVSAVNAHGNFLGSSRLFDPSSGEMVSPNRLLPPSLSMFDNDGIIQEFLIASCAMASVLVIVWKSRTTLPLAYLRYKRLVRRWITR